MKGFRRLLARRRPWAVAPLLLSGLVCSAACSVLVDPARQQCRVDDDCNAVQGVEGALQCKQGLCEISEKIACASSEDCGVSSVCDENLCSEPAPAWACLEDRVLLDEATTITVPLFNASSDESVGEPLGFR